MSVGRRIGIFGGTFNPPHLAHLIVGELVVEAFGLDQLLFIPAFIPPHKSERTHAHPEQRLEMTRLAIEGNDRFAVSNVEVRREGTSYSIDTIREIKRSHQPTELILFIGMDNLAIFPSWKQADEILEECKVVAVSRPTHDPATIPDAVREQVEVFSIPLLEISSTEIRERVRAGRSIRYLVTDEVGSYIEANGLYR